jgi:hypothetical protein
MVLKKEVFGYFFDSFDAWHSLPILKERAFVKG